MGTPTPSCVCRGMTFARRIHASGLTRSPGAPGGRRPASAVGSGRWRGPSVGVRTARPPWDGGLTLGPTAPRARSVSVTGGCHAEGCSAASQAPSWKIPVATPHTSGDNQKCLQTWHLSPAVGALTHVPKQGTGPKSLTPSPRGPAWFRTRMSWVLEA